MSFCVDLVSEDSFHENITLGISKFLGQYIHINVKKRRIYTSMYSCVFIILLVDFSLAASQEPSNL